MKIILSIVLIFFGIALFAQDIWSTKASLNVARSGGAAAVINDKLYVVGGSPLAGGSTQSLEVYDPATNIWTTLPNMPTSRAVAGAAAVNGKLYVMGGCVNSDCNTPTAVLEVYDPVANSWSTKASMPSARSLVACAAIGDKIYVAGNYNGSTATAIVYDVTANTWSSIASMPASLSHAGGAAVNGKFYVIGGSNGSTAQSNVYEYDPVGNSWTTKASLPTARYVPGVGVINNQIYVVSGQGLAGPTSVLEIYNPSTNTWSSKANIPTARYGPAAAAIGYVLYVAGSSSTNGSISTVEAFTATSTATSPSISGFTPSSGALGTTVTISGNNFSGTSSNNIVYFGATKATVTAATTTQLTVTVPAGATHAPITVTTGGLTAYSPKFFVPTFSGAGNISSSSFAARTNFSTASSPWSIIAADFDVDGKTDLAVPNYSSAPNNVISVFKNNSTASTVSLSTKADFSGLGSPTSIALADFDSDGKLDVVIGNVNSVFSVFRNTSSTAPLLSNRLDITAGAATHGQIPGTGDLNNDGKPDFVGGDASGTSALVYILKNSTATSTISFDVATSITTPSASPSESKIVDVDGDGLADVIVANQNNNTISVFRSIANSTAITFAAKVDFATGTRPLYLAIGDVDGDGKLDVAASNANASSVSILRNTSTSGSISFSSKVDFTVGSAPTELDFGDLDGDGKIDLAVANQTSNSISILKNQSTSGTISFAAKVDFTSGAAPQGISIVDINNDQKPDLAFNNNQDNNISVMLNQVTSSSSAPNISSFSPSSGPIGTTVTITGNNFSTTAANNSVSFNGVAAAVPTASSTTSLTATVPTGATSGPIAVTVAGITGTSSTNFNVLANEPSSAPSTLTFSNVAATQVTLNFPAASSITNAAGYIILRRQGSTAITSSGITDGVAPASLTLSSGVSLVTTITNTSTTSFTDTSLTPATAYSYAVVPFNVIGATATSYNYFTTTITGNTLTTLALDSTPPSITDNTPATIEVSTNLTFTATISDSESGISNAIVEWRSIAAGGNVNTVNMVGNGTTYTASINASAINELGIEYKISATSNGGTTTTGATFKTVRIILPAADPGLVISYSDFGSQIENYRIISIPLTLTNASIISVFDELGSYDKLKWRMYRYDNGATAELSASSNLTPGLGYWLIARSNPGRELKTGPGTTVNVTTASPFEIDLKSGWNQIGNPYYFNVAWADVQAANPGIPALRVFNGTFANATVLSATEGGFINVSAAQKLKFPVAKNASVNGRLTETPEEMLQPLSSPDWSVALKLEQGSLVNLISGIGMRQNASLEFDSHDGFNMPRFFDQYLELNHAKKSGTDYYSMDVVPTAQQQEWSFEIQATQGSPIKLSWRNFYFGNNDKALVLWDESLQLAKDMRSTTEYWFDPSTSRKFKIFFGPEAFVKKQTEVEELVLHSPWPNPMVENNLNVSFTIPSSFTKQPVLLELTDLLGRVRHIHQTELMGGYHTVSLSLNESVEGIHILSVQAGNSRKQVKVLIKKNH